MYDDAPERADAPADVGDDDGPVLVCVACETLITRRADAFGLDGEPADRVFFNPAGLVMPITTFRQVRNVAEVGSRTTEFTWFAGYAWTIAVCGACGGQLGWRFDAVGGGRPARFWGLLRARLAEREGPEGG